MEQQQDHQLISYGTYIMIWLALLILTGLTITVAGLNLRNFSIVMAIFIAAFKTTLVLNYFMHLKFETPLFRRVVFLTIFILTINFNLLSFSIFRGPNIKCIHFCLFREFYSLWNPRKQFFDLFYTIFFLRNF